MDTARRVFLKNLSALTVGLLLPDCLPRVVSAAPSPIVIGIVESVTGHLGPFGKDPLQGARLAVDTINSQGGLRGSELGLYVLDDGSRPDQAVASISQLAYRNCVAILGPSHSKYNKQLSEVAEKSGILSRAKVIPHHRDHGLFPTLCRWGWQLLPCLWTQFLSIGLSSVNHDVMSVMAQPVERRVGHDRIREQRHPVLGRPIAGDDYG